MDDIVQVVDIPQPGLKVTDLPAAAIHDRAHLRLVVEGLCKDNVPAGDLLYAVTPILGILSGVLFLAAAAALLRWLIPEQWFSKLIVGGAISSIVLHVIWFSPWAIVPLLVDIVLLWAVFFKKISVGSLRGKSKASAKPIA